MRRYCEDCAPAGAKRYTVNDVDGQRCSACGTTIRFGDQCYYVSS